MKGDAWSTVGEAPFSRGTVPTAVWGHQIVIPNGEARPDIVRRKCGRFTRKHNR